MALAIFLATGVTMQAQDRLTQYKVRYAISVRTPIIQKQFLRCKTLVGEHPKPL